MSQTPKPLPYSSGQPALTGQTLGQKILVIALGSVMVLAFIGVVVGKILTWGPATPRTNTLPSGRSTEVLFAAPRFALTDQNGSPFAADNLRGQAYICDFIFTTCGSACPLMTQKLAALQKQTPAGVQLVSFTVNPQHDTPAVLKTYAAANGADPGRWHFVTGTTEQMVKTVRDMKIGVQAATDHDPILHSEKFLLIDGDGNVRGIYDSLDEKSLKDLVMDAAWLASTPGAGESRIQEGISVTQPGPHFWWHNLPVVNATLNGLSATFLLAAFIMIKRRRVVAHATLIIIALVTSTAFLTCYLLYHTLKARNGELVTRFPPGPWHPWCMALLWPHLILAIVMLPLIAASLWFAWKRQWTLHHKVSSITFPIWFYVSISGVMVYWMLYHLAPTLRH